MDTAKDSVKKDPVFDFSERDKKSTDTSTASDVSLEKERMTIIPPADAYVAERIKAQPKTLEELLSMEEIRCPGKHRLSLPQELELYTKQFQFRWILKDKRAIDESVYKGWVLVNRALFQKLPSHLFSISGGIEEGDLILGCISKRLAEARIKTQQEQSSDLVDAQFTKHKEKPYLYKADLSKEEEGNDQAGDLQEGRDF